MLTISGQHHHNTVTILLQYGDNIVSFSQYGDQHCQYFVTILLQKMQRLVMYSSLYLRPLCFEYLIYNALNQFPFWDKFEGNTIFNFFVQPPHI